MNPTSEILERVNKSSSEHHDGVQLTRNYMQTVEQ